MSGSRPRIFLVPMWIDIDFQIRSALDEWADVATYDPTRAWIDQGQPAITRQWFVDEGIAELDRLGWQDPVLVSDAFSTATAARIAATRPAEIGGIALGHASLSWDTTGDRPPMNGELWAAMDQLLRTDYGNFVRSGLAQLTQGSFGEEFADEMLERVPVDYVRGAWDLITREHEPIGEMLHGLSCPMLLVKHDGCLMFTDEGFDDVTRTFPQASVAATRMAPSADPEYAEALKAFVEGIGTSP